MDKGRDQWYDTQEGAARRGRGIGDLSMNSRHASTTDGDEEEEADEAEGEGLTAARGVSKATRQWCAPLARLRCS